MCGKQGSNFLRNTTAHSFRRISAAVRIGVGEIIVPRTFCLAAAERARTAEAEEPKRARAIYARALFGGALVT